MRQASRRAGTRDTAAVTTFALIHGAWGSGWHWAGVPEELRAMGHEVVAPDLPCEDPTATFDDYADAVIEALGDTAADEAVVVGFSMGGQVAPLVAARRPVREVVYLAAMVPEPGVSLARQFRTGDPPPLFPDYLAGIEPDAQGLTRWVDFEVYHRVTCHDCTEEVARERFARARAQENNSARQPCPLEALPDVPARYVVCTDEKLLDNAYWIPVVRERLGIEPVELPGSHAPMASRPAGLARLLAAA